GNLTLSINASTFSNGNYGISVANTGEEGRTTAEIMHSTISDNSQGGIGVEKWNNGFMTLLLKDVVITHNGGAGISSLGDDSTYFNMGGLNLTVENSVISGNAHNGIQINVGPDSSN